MTAGTAVAIVPIFVRETRAKRQNEPGVPGEPLGAEHPAPKPTLPMDFFPLCERYFLPIKATLAQDFS